MRIVAISDIENRHWGIELPQGDALVCAGDISGNGKTQEITDFNKWLGSQPHQNKIVVAGNHDRLFEKSQGVARLLMTNCHYLQDESIEIDGLKFWGTPWQPIFGYWSFNLPRGEKLAEKWAMIPDDTDVLITHGPPFGIGDFNGWEHVGCEDLRRRVEQLPNLKLHIFGHIHESPGIFRQDGVVFVNASWRPMREIVVIDL